MIKLITFLLNLNIKIGRRLAFYHAQYLAQEEIEQVSKQKKFDLRSMSDRVKNVLLHDQEIIDKRWAECQNCEFLIKPTNSCRECGCFMKIKTRVATARCPIGKWEKEYDFMKGKPINGIIST